MKQPLSPKFSDTAHSHLYASACRTVTLRSHCSHDDEEDNDDDDGHDRDVASCAMLPLTHQMK